MQKAVNRNVMTSVSIRFYHEKEHEQIGLRSTRLKNIQGEKSIYDTEMTIELVTTRGFFRIYPHSN